MCIIPDAQLIQDEWNKHGACAFSNASAYLERQKTLWDVLQKPDLSNLRGYVKAKKIREAWVAANRNIGMKLEHVAIDVERGGDNTFEEVRICYDKKFQLTRCLARGAPDDIDVKVIPRPR
jgi:ribonuclease T2